MKHVFVSIENRIAILEDGYVTTEKYSLFHVYKNVFQNVPSSSPVSIRNKWFINLSSLPISTNVECLLQLGNNFSLPEINKKKITIEFIKNIESNINKLPAPTQAFMRNKSISILNGLARSFFILNDSDKQIIENKKITNQFIKSLQR